MECNAFIYTANVNDFINIADGKISPNIVQAGQA